MKNICSYTLLPITKTIVSIYLVCLVLVKTFIFGLLKDISSFYQDVQSVYNFSGPYKNFVMVLG